MQRLKHAVIALPLLPGQFKVATRLGHILRHLAVVLRHPDINDALTVSAESLAPHHPHSSCVMYSGECGSRYAPGTTNKTWKCGWNSPGRGHVTSSARNECLTAACTRLYRISLAIADSNRPTADPKSFHDELGSVRVNNSIRRLSSCENTTFNTLPSW